MENLVGAEVALLEALKLLNKERENRQEKEERINKANQLLDKAHLIIKQLDKAHLIIKQLDKTNEEGVA